MTTPKVDPVAPAPTVEPTTVQEALAALKAEEAKTGQSGALTLELRGDILDLSDLRAKYPKYHFRWVQVNRPGKAESRKRNGYERVPTAEGGRQVSGLAVFRVAKERAEALTRGYEELAQKRTEAHINEMEEAADAMAKILRDQYGLNIPSSRILIKG